MARLGMLGEATAFILLCSQDKAVKRESKKRTLAEFTDFLPPPTRLPIHEPIPASTKHPSAHPPTPPALPPPTLPPSTHPFLPRVHTLGYDLWRVLENGCQRLRDSRECFAVWLLLFGSENGYM